MSEKPQSFENHARFVPLYHGVLFVILIVNLAWTGYRVIRYPSVGTAEALLLACGLILLALFARTFALSVQDRVIRLEMQLRLAQLLPADVRGRATDFTLDQLIALRFAADAELPMLAVEVLRENLNDRKAIKKRIKNWRADHARA